MAKYPIFLELTGRKVVVIGAGAVAARKAEVLLEAGARLVIVAEDTDFLPLTISQNKTVEIIKSKYTKHYLSEATLVIAATNKQKINEQIYKDCQQLDVLCNVVDEPRLCDFFVPAVVKRGDLQVAIGTEGNCPAYAGHIRKKLEDTFTGNHGEFLSELETLRKRIIADIDDPADRKTLLGRLVDDQSFKCFVVEGLEAWRTRSEQIITEHQKQNA